MAATISGDGTSTLINLTTSGNTILGDASTDTLNVGNGGLVKDASGNVGIGTSSPVSKLDARGSAYLGADSNVAVYAYSSSTEGRIGVGGRSTVSNVPLTFYVADGGSNTERMRIDSSGNLLVGTTSVNFAGSGFTLSKNSGTTKWLVGPDTSASTNFYIASSGSTGVYLNGTGATSWSSNSDERLKTDLKPIENAAEKVASLRAVTGRYKTDEEGYSRAFLIAQDVQAVLPEAVAPTTMYDGTEVLGLAYTETIPLLVAAIQEQQAIITQLQADVAALKGTA